MATITSARIFDARFNLPEGAGSDAIHTDPQYGYAVTVLESDEKISGTGLAYTLGGGTNLICEAIKLLVPAILGKDVEATMAEFGAVQKRIADHHQLRWLGPHKGVIHAALASINNACFDLWAKLRGAPLWKLLLDLTPDALVNLIDLSYLEDVLSREQAVDIIDKRVSTRAERQGVLNDGYPGYDTSAGWFRYDEAKLRDNVKRAMDAGFTAVKLKVGGTDLGRDVRRATLVRELAEDRMTIMLDANQSWPLPSAERACLELKEINPYWIEEPTHPDDVLGHQRLARLIDPVKIAVGEAVANRVLWKNFLEAGAVGVVQADCTRLAGISEYLAVAILAAKYPVKVIPHVGDMGQIHSHLVLFNHVALGHERLFLEYIPHLRPYFVEPVRMEGGRYLAPQSPGCGTELKRSAMRPFALLTADDVR